MSSHPFDIPPTLTAEELMLLWQTPATQEEQELILKYNDAYLPWSELRRKKLPAGCEPRQLWGRMKQIRQTASLVVWPSYGVKLYIPPAFLERLHQLDMLSQEDRLLGDLIPADAQQRYLLTSMVEEAIRSSQIEGAATTRRVAKEMLLKQITPRDRSQKMIRNNYDAISWIREQTDKPMTEELLLELHQIITRDTLRDKACEGRFRTEEDEVYVEDQLTREVIHMPPSAREIPRFVTDLCAFFNASSTSPFIHPILRAIILHFMIAYVHPFVDGNGRTARALFYWYMMRSGYTLMEYLSISQVIREKKGKYEQAYLQAEADGLDIGYFVYYHLKVLEEAIAGFKRYAQRKLAESKSRLPLLALGRINERQDYLLRLFRKDPDFWVTTSEVEKRLGITRKTAITDLKGLVEQGFLEERLLNKVKRGYFRSASFEALLQEAT